ncbi:MAG TPA: hypothetical protein VHA82_13000 [Ramlibacter sp.]|uniref:hypothetical protein n=1 Tax=Ramlibacter sp. TaxID=1917967 RepID=UPI002CA7EEA8|nr:hypothetical protein [Ramlibacter sp.]HVZ44720.1 hypothetical protein [Ramlibacter sp.]
MSQHACGKGASDWKTRGLTDRPVHIIVASESKRGSVDEGVPEDGSIIDEASADEDFERSGDAVPAEMIFPPRLFATLLANPLMKQEGNFGYEIQFVPDPDGENTILASRTLTRRELGPGPGYSKGSEHFTFTLTADCTKVTEIDWACRFVPANGGMPHEVVEVESSKVMARLKVADIFPAELFRPDGKPRI